MGFAEGRILLRLETIGNSDELRNLKPANAALVGFALGSVDALYTDDLQSLGLCIQGDGLGFGITVTHVVILNGVAEGDGIAAGVFRIKLIGEQACNHVVASGVDGVDVHLDTGTARLLKPMCEEHDLGSYRRGGNLLQYGVDKAGVVGDGGGIDGVVSIARIGCIACPLRCKCQRMIRTSTCYLDRFGSVIDAGRIVSLYTEDVRLYDLRLNDELLAVLQQNVYGYVEIVEVPDGGRKVRGVHVNGHIVFLGLVAAFPGVVVISGHFSVRQHSHTLIEALIDIAGILAVNERSVPHVVKTDAVVADGAHKDVLARIIKEVHVAVFRDGSFLLAGDGKGVARLTGGGADGAGHRLRAAHDACYSHRIVVSIDGCDGPRLCGALHWSRLELVVWLFISAIVQFLVGIAFQDERYGLVAQ